MNSFNWADYEESDSQPEQKGFNWADYEEKEESLPIPQQVQEEDSALKSAFRTAWQPVSGFLQATTPAVATSFWQLLAMGEAFDPEEIDRIEQISNREGVPFDRDQYLKAAETALAYIPTIGNLERIAEEQTGAPLQAKTGLQEALRLGSTTAKFAPGTISQKIIAGVAAPTISAGLETAGVPKPIAETVGLGISIPAAKYAPSVSLSKVKKPSGMTERRFESLTEPTKVTETRYGKINEALESDFKDITNRLIEKGPSKETFKNLKENAAFKSEASEAFQEVEKLAESIPEKFNTSQVKNNLLKKRKDKGGFVSGEYEDAYDDFVNSYLKKMEGKEISNKELVRQYRSNNEELGKIYESGKSTAYNDAKRDVLLDFNRSIADTIQERYPNTDYSNLFKESNANWTKIMDAEQINQFLDQLFEGKVQYQKGSKFFEKQRVSQAFRRSLGEEGFENFKLLMNDLMSTKQAMSLLKIAKEKGFTDFARTALSYLVHPSLGAAKTALEIAKPAYQILLDKPKYIMIWQKGIEDAKRGRFSEAQAAFDKIQKELISRKEKE